MKFLYLDPIIKNSLKMKKITIAFLMLLSVQLGFSQFSENFNSGVVPPVGWTQFAGANGLGLVREWVVAGTAPEQYALVQFEDVTDGSLAEDWLVTPLVSITSATNVLQFDQTDNFAIDYGSEYTIRVSTTSQTDISSFTIVDTQDETSVQNGTEGVFSSYNVDLSAYNGQSIYIAFVFANDDGDVWFLDNVELIQGATAPPDNATTPTPADMATMVQISVADANADNVPDNSVVFAWSAATTGESASEYEFLLGDSASSLVSLGSVPSTTTTVTLPRFFLNTTYFWQVIPSNTAGASVNQPVWSFTTTQGRPPFPMAPGVVSNPTPTDMATVPLETNDANTDGNPDNAITFMWTEPTVGDAVELYTFNLGTSPTDLSLFTTGLVGPASTFRLSGLPDNTTFYWTLESQNIAGENTSSPVWEFTTGISASINDNNVNFFTLSPNPTSDILNINTEENVNSIFITNALGQRIEKGFRLNNNSVDVSSLKSGLYFITANSDLGTQTLRFIKN